MICHGDPIEPLDAAKDEASNQSGTTTVPTIHLWAADIARDLFCTYVQRLYDPARDDTSVYWARHEYFGASSTGGKTR